YNLAPRHLHSFPTRRSSDLPPTCTSAPCTTKTPRGTTPHRTTLRSRSKAAPPAPSLRTLSSTPTRLPKGSPRATCFSTRPLEVRSEEHTSELQSRFDLVCRL